MRKSGEGDWVAFRRGGGDVEGCDIPKGEGEGIIGCEKLFAVRRPCEVGDAGGRAI